MTVVCTYGSDRRVRTVGAFRPSGETRVVASGYRVTGDGRLAVAGSIPPGSSAVTAFWTANSVSDLTARQSDAFCSCPASDYEILDIRRQHCAPWDRQPRLGSLRRLRSSRPLTVIPTAASMLCRLSPVRNGTGGSPARHRPPCDRHPAESDGDQDRRLSRRTPREDATMQANLAKPGRWCGPGERSCTGRSPRRGLNCHGSSADEIAEPELHEL